MAPAGTLWSTSYQPSAKTVQDLNLSPWIPKLIFFCWKIKSAAALGGIEIAEPAAYEHMVDNKKPEFLAKFPHGKIPAWESSDGFKLFEGVVIARYGEWIISYRIIVGYLFFLSSSFSLSPWVVRRKY